MPLRDNPIHTLVSSPPGRGVGVRGAAVDYKIATGFTGEPVPPTTRSGLTVSMNS